MTHRSILIAAIAQNRVHCVHYGILHVVQKVKCVLQSWKMRCEYFSI